MLNIILSSELQCDRQKSINWKDSFMKVNIMNVKFIFQVDDDEDDGDDEDDPRHHVHLHFINKYLPLCGRSNRHF
ncbi:unnamed protein product [Schistosoma mattheei]|uniref:Uncharacterized protein n=1 Tax=Schistosoma mattheei TaxID=31246 RepID=A0A183NMF9_9TREM|nr:unnamed protein product [Schistosoma mattheei]